MRLSAEDVWAAAPTEVGALRLVSVPLDRVTEVLPIAGADVSEALSAAIGLGFPPVGRALVRDGVRVVWSAREAALVIGSEVAVEGALSVDQSDGWAALGLEGAVRDVLARLCPLDLRDASFPPGTAARTLLNHVPVLLTRDSDEVWLLLAPRSMAGTVLDEITAAERGLAAR